MPFNSKQIVQIKQNEQFNQQFNAQFEQSLNVKEIPQFESSSFKEGFESLSKSNLSSSSKENLKKKTVIIGDSHLSGNQVIPLNQKSKKRNSLISTLDSKERLHIYSDDLSATDEFNSSLNHLNDSES